MLKVIHIYIYHVLITLSVCLSVCSEAMSDDDEDLISQEDLQEDPLVFMLPLLTDTISNDSSEQTDDELEELYTLPPCSSSQIQNVLLLVMFGGNVLQPDLGHNDIDLQTIKNTFDEVYLTHYNNGVNRVIMRFIACPNVTASVYDTLSSIRPTSQSCPTFPLTALPLMATEQPTYSQKLDELIQLSDKVYCDFLNSEDGIGFKGQVCLLTDCIGSLMVYDILTRPPIPSHTPLSVVTPPSIGLSRSESVPSVSRSVSNVPNVFNVSPGPEVRSDSSCFLFRVSKVFSFGSSLGLVLSLRKLKGRLAYK